MRVKYNFGNNNAVHRLCVVLQIHFKRAELQYETQPIDSYGTFLLRQMYFSNPVKPLSFREDRTTYDRHSKAVETK